MDTYLRGVKDFIICNCCLNSPSPLLVLLEDGQARPIRWPPGMTQSDGAGMMAPDYIRLCPDWRYVMMPKGFSVQEVGNGRQAVFRTTDPHSEVVIDNDEILLPGEAGCLAYFLGVVGEDFLHKAYMVKPHDEPRASLVPLADFEVAMP